MCAALDRLTEIHDAFFVYQTLNIPDQPGGLLVANASGAAQVSIKRPQSLGALVDPDPQQLDRVDEHQDIGSEVQHRGRSEEHTSELQSL